MSIKALTENPWDKIAQELQVGSFVTGKVIKIADFGAFVKLQNSDIEAFIHVSECSDTPNVSISDVLVVGNSYSFKVLRVTPEEQKIGLSLRKEEKRYNNRSNNNSSENKSGNKYEENRSEGNKFSKHEGGNFSKDRKDNKREASSYSSSSENAPKKKSAFQIELEKLMEQQKKAKENN